MTIVEAILKIELKGFSHARRYRCLPHWNSSSRLIFRTVCSNGDGHEIALEGNMFNSKFNEQQIHYSVLRDT